MSPLIPRFLAAILIAAATPSRADELVGKARAIGGDTLEVGGRTVRLFGIDATDGGRNAAFALAFETAEHWVSCDPRGGDSTAPLVAVCFVGPYDLGEIMVRKGWARATANIYATAEAEARGKRLGLWNGAPLVR